MSSLVLQKAELEQKKKAESEKKSSGLLGVSLDNGGFSSYAVSCGSLCKSMCCLGAQPQDDNLKTIEEQLIILNKQVRSSSLAVSVGK